MRALLITLFVTGVLAAQTTQLTALEKEFQDSLNNAVLQGQSSRDGRAGVSDDKYNIEKVVKQSGDNWLFYVRVDMQGKQMTLPLPIQIKWAGDTAVITITNQSLPGMGTYTARVLIYKGHYAGTWSGGERGGKVFGQIVKQ